MPLKLECDAHRLEKKNENNFKRVKSDKWNVINPIDRAQQSYHLDGSKKIDPIDINAIDSAAPLTLPVLPIELQKAAGQIFAAVQKRRDENKPKFGIYQTLEAEAGLKDGQAKQWSIDGYLVLR